MPFVNIPVIFPLKSLNPPSPEVHEAFCYACERFTIAPGVPGFDVAYDTFGGEYGILTRPIKSFASDEREGEAPTWTFAAGYKSFANA